PVVGRAKTAPSAWAEGVTPGEEGRVGSCTEFRWNSNRSTQRAPKENVEDCRPPKGRPSEVFVVFRREFFRRELFGDRFRFLRFRRRLGIGLGLRGDRGLRDGRFGGGRFGRRGD